MIEQGIFTMQDFIDTTGGLSGSGTIGKVAKFTATDAIGDGLIDDNGTSVNNTGAGGISYKYSLWRKCFN